jgi:hypothetical protein
MCIILNGYRNTAVLIYKYKSIVNGNNEDTLVTVHFIVIFMYCLHENLLHRSDKFVTVHNKSSKI